MARRPMEAAGAVDAQNAPTAPWKTAQNAVSHSYHRHSHRESGTRVLPMFPVNFVTYLPGCSLSGRGSRSPNHAPVTLACPARGSRPLARQRRHKIIHREIDRRLLAAAVDPDQGAIW